MHPCPHSVLRRVRLRRHRVIGGRHDVHSSTDTALFRRIPTTPKRGMVLQGFWPLGEPEATTTSHSDHAPSTDPRLTPRPSRTPTKTRAKPKRRPPTTTSHAPLGQRRRRPSTHQTPNRPRQDATTLHAPRRLQHQQQAWNHQCGLRPTSARQAESVSGSHTPGAVDGRPGRPRRPRWPRWPAPNAGPWGAQFDERRLVPKSLDHCLILNYNIEYEDRASAHSASCSKASEAR